MGIDKANKKNRYRLKKTFFFDNILLKNLNILSLLEIHQYYCN